MRVTQWGEFGIHFSVHIAEQELLGRTPIGAAEIAKAQGVDLDYAHQILQRLRKGDVLKSVRGAHGGYVLSRPSENISLRQILLPSEGDTFEVMCEVKPLNASRCAPGSDCSLRGLWHELKENVDSFLENRSLRSLLKTHGEVPGEKLIAISSNIK